MDDLGFWQQKIVQFFHDPPAKPFSRYGSSAWFRELVNQWMEQSAAADLLSRKSLQGHRRIAAALFEAYTGVQLKFVNGAPDWCSASADRPMLYAIKRSDSCDVYWLKAEHRLIVHPLARRFRLQVEPSVNDDSDTRKDLAQSLLEGQMALAADLASPHPDWSDAEGLRIAFFTLWRRFREDLVTRRSALGMAPGSDPLWEEMPSDSRCPDHSIWDHLRVTTALAFLKPHRMNTPAWLGSDWEKEEGAQAPWLMRVSLGPAQAFIAEARTGRDLWTGSMLLAELAWAAMQPFVERYGPDSILYPDLRANPRVDNWLADAYPDAIPAGASPSTFAALLPNAFVAMVPRGGDGHLLDLEALAGEAQRSMQRRWRDLAEKVELWLAGLDNGSRKNGAWRAIWKRQHAEPPIYCIWTAIPWLPLGHIRDPRHLLARTLPAQQEGFREPEDPAAAHADREVSARRTERLAPWVPAEVWSLYERTRLTFANAHVAFHQMERGFDYALTHHQLSARHALRKGSYPSLPGTLREEHGEKCTLCGGRQALTDSDANLGLDRLREEARRFWSHEDLDPDRTGAERLCGVCALKRFLVAADQGPTGLVFNGVWRDPHQGPRGDKDDDDGKLRVPFPSTATVAAQRFVAQVLIDGALRSQADALLDAARRARLPRTSFPRSLPRIAARAAQIDDKALRGLLYYEPEDLFFPDAVEGRARGLDTRADAPDRTDSERLVLRHDAERLRQVAEASRALLHAARERGARNSDTPTAPGTQIAVIRMDGDRMGRLLLGDPECIATRWRDVIHPDAVRQIGESRSLLDAGWADLLDAKRLMGPSLHAFVTRALGAFSHRIVPWVVEREFSGRLIYAGGDDLLCLAPADEALDLAARLQQLFSAAWVLDTRPDAKCWGWRHPGWSGPYDQDDARRRFAIPLPARNNPDGEPEPIRLPVADRDLLEPHAASDGSVDDGAVWTAPLPAAGSLLPMLGRGVSLSAGIAIGHYKTPLSVLLGRAKALLDLAKQPYREHAPPTDAGWTGRAALAIGHASRGGVKTGFALPWTEPDATGLGAPTAHRVLKTVRNGFGSGELPSRLPYKLRELARDAQHALAEIADGQPHARPGTDGDQDPRERLLRGLFAACLDGGDADREPFGSALALWSQGIRLHDPQHPQRWTDGLLLCRALAGGAGDAEEDAR